LQNARAPLGICSASVEFDPKTSGTTFVLLATNSSKNANPTQMPILHKVLAALILAGAAAIAEPAVGQIEIPRTAATAGRDSGQQQVEVAVAPLRLTADLSARMLTVKHGDTTLKTYQVAVGQEKYPTPPGRYKIRKIVWNPSWHPPPDAAWAKGKTAKGPGDPGNPMKVVKIFFKEPDYYIHGTGDVESLGSAASHGCLRMDPNDVADLAKLVMEHGGQPRDENWFWRIIHSRREEKVVYLDNPVSLTVSD
jgi:lipoprotein-anchoring transpeptidase ErfK/SrfK